jgi:hypothetical protein
MRRIRYNFHNETSLGAGHPTIKGGSQPALANTVKVIYVRSTILAGALVFSAVFVLSAIAHRSPEAANTTARADGTRSPVLVELFTSEGCSSCPPADELLRKLDASQPVAGAEIIALSEHVDYWDDIGWKDPFSARANSQRQDRYSAQLGSGVYTPQMVVDGVFEFVGSDGRSAVQAVGKAAAAQKIAVSLNAVQGQGGKVSVQVQTGPLPASSSAPAANVVLAIADDTDVSNVARGENSGRTLSHVAVLREWKTVGTVDKTKGFSQTVETDLQASGAKKSRVIVIVQEGHEGRIVGLASTRSPS